MSQVNKALGEIQNADVEYDVEPITILLTDDLCEKMEITGEVMDELDGFVTFEMEG